MQQQQNHKQQQHQQMSIELSESNLKPSVTMGGLKIKASLQNVTSASTTTNIAHPTTTTSSSTSSSSLTSVSCPLTSTAVAVNPPTTISTTTGYSNSLLKQQLRFGLKEVPITTNNNNNNSKKINCNANDGHVMNAHEACTALQSLAHAAEKQANNIQPPTANNLHHQFMLHMAANPILKPTTGGEYYQHQQQSQQQEQLLLKDDDHNMDLLLDHNNDDKSDPEMLTLADENAGLDFTLNIGNNGEPQMLVEKQLNTENNLTINGNNNSNNKSTTGRGRNASSKPIQRRRIRRKAQSSLDDPAEQLTEMSVRGLDLFRYASISEGVYQCTECAKENLQKTFKNKYSFQRHAFLYHEGKQRKVFPCTLCGKGFSRPDKMKNHIKMVHEVANFNSLNYLITAAAGELSTVTAAAAAAAKATQAGMRQSTAANNCSQLNVVPSPTPLGERSRSEGCGSAGDETKLLFHNNKLRTDNVSYSPDIEIKNEIIISPSPSPPPLTALDAATQQHQQPQNLQLSHHSQAVTVIHNVSKSLLKMTAPQSTQTHNASQLSNNAQRLEEVK